ncbi:MAG: anti-sigma factor family protein [Paracoccaceae bacterium]
MTRDWTEEDIAAYVDGALDPADAERVAAILEHDEEARGLADQIDASNAMLRAAFADVANAPVPAALTATLAHEGDTVVPMRWRFARPTTWVPAAAAASVAIVVGVLLGTQIEDNMGSPQITLGDAPSDSALHLALETLPSGTAFDDRIMPMLTFTDKRGRYCREFEVLDDLPNELEFGIACRTETAAWHVEIIVSAPMNDSVDQGFAPASGPGADALAAMIEALGGSEPLSPDAESVAVRNNWQR